MARTYPAYLDPLLALRRFESTDDLDMNLLKASLQGQDTFLFHGTAPSAIPNILVEGLLLANSGFGMLGPGIYGAPAPRKASYSQLLTFTRG